MCGMDKEARMNITGFNAGITENLSDSFTRTGGKHARPRLLLHSCCGPCSTAVIERLYADYDITVFYYNPCITDAEEYEHRKAEQIRFISEFNAEHSCGQIKYMEGRYDPREYYEQAAEYSEEPEGGKRCEVCFRIRLRETAKNAARLKFDLFSTTLSVSPHKNYKIIAEIGREAAEEVGTEFLAEDFKKKAGFQRSIQLSKEHGLYRQNYCGCEYSKRGE